MATDPESEVKRCLECIREQSDGLVHELRMMSAAAWDGPTNCAPWRVRDLAVHVVTSGEGFVASIRRGLAGSVEPSVSDEGRHRRQVELAAAGPETVAGALQAVTAEFVGLYAGLDEDELAAICFHRRGNRSVRWYAAHRLAEVAFHSWDLQLSLGRSPKLDEHVAALLLPTLLESNAPRTYAAGLSPQRGSGERYLLAVTDGDCWLITIEADRLVPQRSGSLVHQAVADPAGTPGRWGDPPPIGSGLLSITCSAADLALLAYGRAELHALAEAGAVRLDGDLTLVDRFPLIFPRP
jgi:uncharacterized protein (TIGR03083 family)